MKTDTKMAIALSSVSKYKIAKLSQPIKTKTRKASNKSSRDTDSNKFQNVLRIMMSFMLE